MLRAPSLQSRWFKTLLVSAALVGVLIWNPAGKLEPVRNAVGTLVQPVERVFSFFGFMAYQGTSFFRDVGTLKAENSRLVMENQRMLADVVRLEELDKENAVLREQLELLPRERFSFAGADVIGEDAENAGHWLFINKGSRHGLAAGMPVTLGQGVLVGRLTEVSPWSARVMLLTHPGSVISVADGRTEARGIARGQFGAGLLLDMVFQGEEMTSGDRIVTVNHDGIPFGLLVGTIGDTMLTPDRLFRQANIVPAGRFQGLRAVFVLLRTHPL